MSKVEAKMECAMEEEISKEAAVMREATLSAEETPSALKCDEGNSYEESRLDELASTDMSATRAIS
jgi:hypothetical protein